MAKKDVGLENFRMLGKIVLQVERKFGEDRKILRCFISVGKLWVWRIMYV